MSRSLHSVTTFSSGPWFATIHPRAGEEPAFALVRGIDSICAMRNTGDRTDEQMAADANLIAAAPDLYAACEAAAEYVQLRTPGGSSDPLYKRLLAALVRAQGGTLDPKTAADTARDLGLRKPRRKVKGRDRSDRRGARDRS